MSRTKIAKIHLKPVYDGTLVRWSLPSPQACVLEVSTDARRWEEVGRFGPDTTSTTDTKLRRAGLSDVFYRVVFNDGSVRTSLLVAGLSSKDRRVIQEIVRKEHIAIRQGGIAGFLLPRRDTGEKCSCTAGTQFEKKLHASYCTRCYGTGIVGGYYAPVQFSWKLLPPTLPKRKESDATGNHYGVLTVARAPISIPLIKGDVLVNRATGQRFYVESLDSVLQYKGVPVIYEKLLLREAPADDIIFKFRIKDSQI